MIKSLINITLLTLLCSTAKQNNAVVTVKKEPGLAARAGNLCF
jgi:hypothetical protein